MVPRQPGAEVLPGVRRRGPENGVDVAHEAGTSLTHFDAAGRARMVDVGGKVETDRTARARGTILVGAAVFEAIESGTAGKGDVLGVARIAAIQGAKRTADLIPLCHPLPLSRVEVSFELARDPCAVHCEVLVHAHARTGVEMEALMAVQIGLLTVYDMCKAMDRGMRIDGVRLLEKRGGTSGHWIAP